MKHNTLARLFLGVSLLLLVGPLFAQNRNSRKSTSKSDTTAAQTPKRATACPSPTPPSLAGSYILDDPGASEKVNAAIEAAVKDLSVFTRGTVRDKLRETNLPPPQHLTISYTENEVVIATEISGEVRTATNGTPSDWSRGQDKYKVSTIWEDANLVRTFKGSGGERVNVYSLCDGCGALSLGVSVTRKSSVGGFKLVYSLKYQRVK